MTTTDTDAPLFASPPVVQHASPEGFTVSIEVSRLCTGCVEWGWRADALEHRAIAEHHGLIDASDSCLVIPVAFPEPAAADRPVFYRVVAQPLDYATAYELSRGRPAATPVRGLRLPRAECPTATLAFVNDTHGRADTTEALAARVEAIDPDLLIWNGDACRSFDDHDDVAGLLLRPGANGAGPCDGGWAATRPLVFVPGNHDLRGRAARRLPAVLPPGPLPRLPYNAAMRIGPLALVTLVTGEDKPDHHPVFAGTAAYEPHRRRQATWLTEQLARPAFADAPFKLAVCHIPLRGEANDNDGTTLEGHARFSDDSAGHWLTPLVESRVDLVVSGHTHAWRIDPPTDAAPITQVVGGGPDVGEATVIVLDVSSERMDLRIAAADGTTLATRSWAGDGSA